MQTIGKVQKTRLRTVVLAAVAGVVLQGCQDTTWRGVVDTGPLEGEPAYRVDKGKFSTFEDCERAMKAQPRGSGPLSPSPQGFVNREFTLKCVQGDAVIEIRTGYDCLWRGQK